MGGLGVIVENMKEKIIVQNNIVVSGADKDTKEIIERAISKLLEFFPDAKTDFELVFLETRKEMDETYGSKTEDWVVGGVYKENIIYIFDKEVYSKVSCHPQKNFFSTLVHEIAHIYTTNLFNLLYPIWLNEGIAYVIAGQGKEKPDVKEDITNAHDYQGFSKTHPYVASGNFVRFLLEKYGKGKLIQLIKTLVKLETKENFEKKFKEIYIEDFNGVVEGWIKGVDNE